MRNIIRRILIYLKSIIHLSDEIDYENASASIRKNIAFRGTNVYILACAIIIASVGLNVNSIPVIIGAMLVSPVMGPILGFGLGLGTRDNLLVKNSMKNFGVMVVISIVASALFFLLSPLSLAHPSELLARTNPTIYDVLIALFGGLAGIIETSRKDKGTVISGVAIATALMPPLCTVGYGISIWKGQVIFGALYLFLINSIFIALATFAAVKYFSFPVVENTDESHRRLPKHWMAIILIIVIVPSIISAVSVIKENNFTIHAERLVAENKNLGKCFIYDHKATYSRKDPKLELFLAGETLTDEAKKQFYKSAEEYGITRSQIVFHEDATIMKQDLSETEIMKGFFEHSDQQIKALNDSIMKLDKQLSDFKGKELPVEAVSKELFAQYPDIQSLSLSRGAIMNAGNPAETEQVVAIVTIDKPMDAELHARIERWLKARLNNENVVVVEQIAEKEKATE
ncbi:MAG: DUF389 domain-containing protein [Bacteroidales bacterium]|nr:DUF389 domain-containing protein [Bacteroidales bacterium]